MTAVRRTSILCAALLTLPAGLHAAAPPVLTCPAAAETPVVTTAAHMTVADAADAASIPAVAPGQLIVIGFMGGNVSASNLVHREAMVAKHLQQKDPSSVYAEVFANSDSAAALHTVAKLLDRNKNGCLSDQEKSAARIVLFGHSWGASETITLAQKLNALKIPVLLTIQVDSVQKLNEHDNVIPANVHEAINFYQTEGLLHGRALITAADPKQTTILGNFQSSYKKTPVAIVDFPWYARAFMKPHVEIENDPVIWDKIEGLIQAKVL